MKKYFKFDLHDAPWKLQLNCYMHTPGAELPQRGLLVD